ncbi:hypothetical protein_gp192 [Bacillus phage vB_BceM_WH1]|nr:hypothetical protein_gp192 [Bacillus phage vB_BceM_WH1]
MLLPLGTKVIIREGTQFKGQDSYFKHGYNGSKEQGYGIINHYINIEDFCYSVLWYKQNGERYGSNNYRRRDLQAIIGNNEEAKLQLKVDDDILI